MICLTTCIQTLKVTFEWVKDLPPIQLFQLGWANSLERLDSEGLGQLVDLFGTGQARQV